MGQCSGCPQLGQARAWQWQQGRQRLNASLAAAGVSLGIAPLFVDLGSGGLRDRVDLTMQRQDNRLALGLYNTARTAIVDPDICRQMSPALAAWHKAFRQHLPPLTFTHLRLRVGVDGRRGVWLDMPRREQEALLTESAWLEQMTELAHVEIGQRRLVPRRQRGGWVLDQPVWLPWFGTPMPEGRLQPLYGQIAGFSQVGLFANRVLVEQVGQMMAKTGVTRWLELGCGNGNLTLPAAARGWRMHGLEQDGRALQGLELAAREAGLTITTSVANFHARHAPKVEAALAQAEGLLVDPPRSGLGGFVDLLASTSEVDQPAAMVMVSCFADSFAADYARLHQRGYRLVELAIIDLFPQSQHFEYVARLTRD